MVRKCEICLEEMVPREKESKVRWAKRRFCSKGCKNKWWKVFKTKVNPVWTAEYEREYQKNYRKSHLLEAREHQRQWRKNNRVRVLIHSRTERDALKLAVMIDIGGNRNPVCAVCGYADLRALSIDHKYNDGAEERRRLFGNRLYAGTTFYRWLRKNNYPNRDRYQVLCMNCQFVKKLESVRININ